MRTCAVCFRRSDRAENKSFHRLPLYKPELYMAWLRAMRYRDADAPVRVLRRRDIRLCDDHFSPDDLIQGAEHKSLREGAVPSIFPWTPAEPGVLLKDQRRKDVACQSSQTQDNWTMTTSDLESKENKGQNGVISDSRHSDVLRWADTSTRGARECLSASTSADDGHYLVDLESPTQHVVDEECILQLFRSCLECNKQCTVRKRVRGLQLVVYQACYYCHYRCKWSSQPDGEDVQTCRKDAALERTTQNDVAQAGT